MHRQGDGLEQNALGEFVMRLIFVRKSDVCPTGLLIIAQNVNIK